MLINCLAAICFILTPFSLDPASGRLATDANEQLFVKSCQFPTPFSIAQCEQDVGVIFRSGLE